MAINIVYQPDPMLVGQAAYQIGQGEYARYQQDQALQQQQFAEQQRQFDARNALDQQQFDLARENSLFDQQIARNREQLARRGLAMDFLNRNQQMGAEFALADQRGNVALEQQAMESQSAANRQYQQMAYQAMMTDLENVRKELPKLDPNQRQQLLDQFYNNWDSYNIPLPTPINPEVPDWANPEKILQSRQQEFPGLPWGIDPETGQVGLPRGFNYTTTPQGMQQQFEHQRELEGMKTQFKQEESQTKVEQKQAENKQRWEEHDQDMYQRWQQYDLDMRQKEHEGRMPRKEEFQVDYTDPATNQVKQKLNVEAFNKAMQDWRSNAPRAPQSPMSQPPQDSGTPMPPEWTNLPIGGVMTLPNGVRIKKTGPTSFVRI